MVEKSAYLQEALKKPFFHYFTVLATISPVHVYGIVLLSTGTIIHLRSNSSMNRALKVMFKSKFSRFIIECWSLAIWPLAFLVGHMLVGIFGGGYQTRFILPIIPATSMITALAQEIVPGYESTTHCLVAIGAMHVLFYGVMFYPLFCEFEFSVFDIVQTILDSPQYAPESQKELSSVFKYLQHYGLHRSSN